MVRGLSEIDWAGWSAALLTVVLAISFSLAGTEVVRWFAVRQLDGLRSAHWTEQARVFTDTNNVSRLFRLYLITVTTTHRADALAHRHEHDAGDYAAALERVYQLNWMAAGVVNRTHPSLYDRMEKAGVRPSYARPKPPARSPGLLALAFGLVGALALAFIVNPLLAALFETPR